MSENCVLQAATSLTVAKAYELIGYIGNTRDVAKRVRDNIMKTSPKRYLLESMKRRNKLTFFSSIELIIIKVFCLLNMHGLFDEIV